MFTTELKFDALFTDLQFLNHAVREKLDYASGMERNYTFYATEKDDKTCVFVRCEEQLNDQHINWKADNFDCQVGDELKVNVRANPVDRVDGKYCNLTGKAARTYFRDMLHRAGLEVIRIKLSNSRLCIKREGLRDIGMLAQSFTSDVRVIDKEKFMQSYGSGIGRRKNVGFGMIKIMEHKVPEKKAVKISV